MSIISKKILPADGFQIKVHQFYISTVILEYLQITSTLCLNYIYPKPLKYTYI